ncbi:NAD(P)-binding protein [Punctularia strigosozonata HHB-11173 SS5]|uniref:NAD(P)-binding protein n=1 Tax=Punctularia strigosozonata (strain HHB-11173) TaxID=741275 RepID=UPI0004416942|nr:NAD(P)-binding protein [Punctularia strigosozonata HHB-11173 SS5]EIN06094.1 NAD(P)-binding protein [Punctularia strigosozonata HHB-11173 SS5]
MTPVVYLVSGSNRGIGFGLVKALSARENTVVFAGARDPEAAKDLNALAAERPGKLHLVKLISADARGNEEAVALIKERVGRLDVVIANAGMNQAWGPLHEASEEDLRKHFEINAIGPFVLFKAALPLLKASSPAPKFVMISSQGGGIQFGAALPFPLGPYGISKAAGNYLARKLHHEHEEDGLIVFPICPGAADTNMSTRGAEHDERIGAIPVKTVDETARLLLNVIDNATRENEGGQFMNFDGAKNPW